VLDLGGRTSFAELAEVLAGADAVVVGNTGPAHLAAAVGTPVVSLYAPTVPAVRWRPWQVPHELLHLDVPVSAADVARAVARLAGPVALEAAA
jgi:ADP-heptose:LPS heptosyltransferase